MTNVEALGAYDNDAKAALLIQRNLYNALVRVWSKRSTHPILIWADSICIDQKNLDERVEQVKLMGRIYDGAHSVIFWLGDDVAGLEHLEYLHGPLARSLGNLRNEQDRGAICQFFADGIFLLDLCHAIKREAFGALFWFYSRCRW